MSTTSGEERIYQAYKTDRDHGATHEELAASGLYPDARHYLLRYDLAVANYANAMVKRDRVEPPKCSDFDPYFGRRLADGNA